jgi:hypothetical protein
MIKDIPIAKSVGKNMPHSYIWFLVFSQKHWKVIKDLYFISSL